MILEQLTNVPAHLGEGPCWHAGEQALYWVDILGCSLHRFDPVTGTDQAWPIGERVGTVAPRASGGLVLGLEHGFAFFQPGEGTLERLPEIEPGAATRFNDGKCDPSGRFWCGSMDLAERNGIGALYRMDADQRVTKHAEGITVSNGLGWSLDQREMYYIDSAKRCVWAFEYDPASGDLGQRRVAIQLGEDEGFPDGMTTDAEGMIWLAQWAGACVTRRDPRTGQCLQRIKTPAWQTSACCFGGSDLRDLYLTSARVNLTAEQAQQYPGSGHLFRTRLPLAGAPTHAYAG